MKMFNRLIAAGMVALSIAGCASPFDTQMNGAVFVPPARDISSAFLRANGDLYIVPEKGVIIQDVLGVDGRPISWNTNGSYIVISAQSTHANKAVDLVIFDKLRRQATSAAPRARWQ